jgi:hypothetical protein
VVCFPATCKIEAHAVADRLELTAKIISTDLSEFPVLEGAGVKGATIRALVPWLTKLADDLSDDSRPKVRRKELWRGMFTVYRVLETGGLFLSAKDLADLQSAIQTVCATYAYLAHHHMEAGRVRYNLTFKHHYLHHLSVNAETCNPYHLSTYTEESFVSQGKVRLVHCPVAVRETASKSFAGE